MIAARASAAVIASTLIGILGTGCDRPKEGSNLDENIERTVGEPQKSPGMFGGNDAPESADAACCTEARDAGASVEAP